MFFRVFGWVMLAGVVLGCVGELGKLEFPTVRFPFTMSRDIGWLHVEKEGVTEVFPWFGWSVMAVTGLFSVWWIVRFSRPQLFSPITQRRIERFKQIRRGYLSLLLICALGAVAALDHVVVGAEALVVKRDGKWRFPAFTRVIEKHKDFGIEDERADIPADYRAMKRDFRKAGKGDWVIMPLLPYGPTNDTLTAVLTKLDEKDGLLVEGGERFSGLASRVYEAAEPERMHLRFRYRRGLKDGPAEGWDREGAQIYGAEYRDGELLADSVSWNGGGELADFLAIESGELVRVRFPPSPPNLTGPSKHLLGTNSQGYDVLAYLFGGLQVNFKAALFYIPLVYVIGISIGLMMGYFGGTFDLVVQRLIEILSNIPFLFVVMIASTAIPPKLKETAGLWIILGIIAAFGWMGMTYLMRTAALKEKARDYIAATRVLGASTPRILLRHLLPNSIAIVVTLIPFSVSGLILALTSLDYLGFGLPPKYASWGQLLKDGLDNLSSPWLVTSAFTVLVCLLILVTFVGEAVREAFDPKKFSYYR